MPSNLYGPGDNYNPENSHVLPALIRRFHEEAEADSPSVTCCGSVTPLREFLHIDDLGEACVFLLDNFQPGPDQLPYINVGTGVDISIRELAESFGNFTNFAGQICWDTSKPDGTPRKLLDVSRLAGMGWKARIPLENGLELTTALFREQLSSGLVRL
jgi:GDP-L-fucose synthase